MTPAPRNRLAFILALLSLAAAATAARAAGKPSPRSMALFGSVDFQPSPERPVGWRGDGTGRFPGATPPLEWYRRPKGVFNSLRELAARPKSDEPAGEPLNMGTVRQWLVVGPFAAKDHATALDDVSQSDEAELQPTAGDKLNGKTWTAMPVSVGNQSQSWARLVLDLALAYGEDERQERQNHPGTLDPGVAYACQLTPYAAEAGRVRLHVEATQAIVWLNGAPVKVPAQFEPRPVVELKQGWNRLLVKMASSKRNWNMSALIFPVADSGYETKNIVWMAAMPGPSWSSPIVVGSKVFVNADDGTLVCLNKEDGRTLWTHDVTYYDAISAEDRAAFPELAAKQQELDVMVTPARRSSATAGVDDRRPTATLLCWTSSRKSATWSATSARPWAKTTSAIAPGATTAAGRPPRQFPTVSMC